MKKKSVRVLIVLLVLAIAGAFVWHVIRSGRKPVEIVGSVTLGFVEGEAASAIYVADKLNFYAANGVKVTLRPFAIGLSSYQAMLKGEVDVSGPTEFVIVGGAFRDEKIQIVSTIVKADLISIIGRKDHGIGQVADLAGKRIGLPQNTISEFYLGRFLDLHGLSRQEVTLIDMNFSEGAAAIGKDVVDAVVTLPPFSNSIKSSLGMGLVEWPAQSGQLLCGVLTCRKDWIARNPDLVGRLLKALDQANGYLAQHPREAKSIVKQRLNLDAETIDRIWQRNLFSLSLDQSLITAMEDEARWMIANKMTTARQIPDFLNYLYLEGLKTVKPEAVNIMR
jgi:NitT/TauT family transport system substrate-binding protein